MRTSAVGVPGLPVDEDGVGVATRTGVLETLGVDVPSANKSGDDVGVATGPEAWRCVVPIPRVAIIATNVDTSKIAAITRIMRGILANLLRGVPGNDGDGCMRCSSGSTSPPAQTSIKW